jgi:hypothetical protein
MTVLLTASNLNIVIMSNSKANMSTLTATDVLAIISTYREYMLHNLNDYYNRNELKNFSKEESVKFFTSIFYIPTQIKGYTKVSLNNALLVEFNAKLEEWENNNDNNVKLQIVKFLKDNYFNKEENKDISLTKFVIDYFESIKNNSKQESVSITTDTLQMSSHVIETFKAWEKDSDYEDSNYEDSDSEEDS